MDVAKELAHLYFQMDEIDNAYDILRNTFNQYPEHVTFYGKLVLPQKTRTIIS